MLKRQRPSSPHILPSDGPLPGSSPEFAELQSSKRRRVTAPRLDSNYRGWKTSSSEHQPPYEDDGEEDYFSEEEGGPSGDTITNKGPALSGDVPQPYASTNDLLHHLHAQHQQRLQRSEPPSQSPSLACTPSTSYSAYPITPTHGTHTPYIISHSSPPGPLPGHHLNAWPAHPSATLSPSLSSITGPISESEESLRVKERYEDTNK